MSKKLLLKPLIRLIAFDDGFFTPKKKGKALLVGILSRLDNRVEGIVSAQIAVDGFDSTKKIISLIQKTRFGKQAQFILLSGLNFAGFNVVDAQQLHKKTGKPVLVVFRKHPDMKKFFLALKKTKNAMKRWQLVLNAGCICPAGKIHFQAIGLGGQTARQLIKKLCINSNLPEPIRLAHLVASGISLGESTRP